MSSVAARPPLVEQVLAGGSRELTLLAAQGLLPLPAGEVLALQAQLARHPDPEVAGQALQALRAVDARVGAEFLAEEADHEALALFAREARHPLLLETILRRRDLPGELLTSMAPRLTAELQEVLLLRQDAIVADPGILEALAQNPQLSAYSVRRIAEYREHLLPKVTAEEAAPALDGAMAAEIDAVRQAAAEGEVDEISGLSETQVRLLSLPLRLRLARGASRTLRGILVRDVHPAVAVAVLQSNPLSDQEIEQIARNRSVLEEVLEHIARHRDWSRKYAVIVGLVGNPRTPVASALRLLPRLGVRDLRNLTRDRNIPDAVRSQAGRLYRIKVG